MTTADINLIEADEYLSQVLWSLGRYLRDPESTRSPANRRAAKAIKDRLLDVAIELRGLTAEPRAKASAARRAAMVAATKTLDDM